MTAARAAGTGGKSRGPRPKRPPQRDAHGNPTTTSRRARLDRAHAAGRSGKPAPAWIDDAELLAAYDEGASTLGSSWAGDVDEPATAQAPSSSTSPPPPAPAPLPQPGPLFPHTRSIAPGTVRTTGPAGDAAGLFLGLIATAFAINVLKGTSSQWLRAKFLNETNGSGRPDPNAAPGLFPSLSGSGDVPTIPASGNVPAANGQGDNANLFGPGGVLRQLNNSQLGVAAPGATIDPLTGELASPLPKQGK